MLRRRHFFVVLLSAAGVAARSEPVDGMSAGGLGHLALRTVSPGHLLRPNVGYANTEPIRPGGTAFRAALTLGNVWLRREGAYVMDGEWLVADLVLTHAVTDSFRLSAGLPLIGRFGGFGDGAIEWFHRTARIGNANREDFPRNRFLIRLVGPDGEVFEDDEDAWNIGDVPLYATLIMRSRGGTGPVVFANFGLTLPTGDEQRLAGLGQPLWGGSLLMFQRIGQSRWVAYGGGSVSYTRPREVAGIELREAEFGALGGLRFDLSDRTALLVQYLLTSPVARDYHTFSDYTHEVQIGVKHRIGEQAIIEVAVVENVFRFTNSADVGLHAALTWLW